jgi:hypothetical protein
MIQTKERIFKYIHALIWILWALLTLTYQSGKTQNAYNLIFGRYVSYGFFHWFELIFMFGGGLLLLALLVKLMPKKITYLSYLLFELLFIGIVAIKLIAFLHQ